MSKKRGNLPDYFLRWKVPCPACGVESEKSCISLKGPLRELSYVHEKRYEAARRKFRPDVFTTVSKAKPVETLASLRSELARVSGERDKAVVALRGASSLLGEHISKSKNVPTARMVKVHIDSNLLEITTNNENK